jgi:steroid delta-isomerase-like uncharacterized protein
MGHARDVAEQYIGAIEKGDVDAAIGLFTSDAEYTSPIGRLSLEDARATLRGYAAAFPQNKFEVHTVIEAGDLVVLEGSWLAKHNGDMGLPTGEVLRASGRSTSSPFATVFRVQGSKIASHRSYWDRAAFMSQLLGP